LCIEFYAGGSAKFFPVTDDAADLGRRWGALIHALVRGEGVPVEVAPSYVNEALPRQAEHHVCLDFYADGRVVFHFATRQDTPAEVGRCFLHVVTALAEQPTAIGCAAGDHPR
jgi:hypothetical protein